MRYRREVSHRKFLRTCTKGGKRGYGSATNFFTLSKESHTRRRPRYCFGLCFSFLLGKFAWRHCLCFGLCMSLHSEGSSCCKFRGKGSFLCLCMCLNHEGSPLDLCLSFPFHNLACWVCRGSHGKLIFTIEPCLVLDTMECCLCMEMFVVFAWWRLFSREHWRRVVLVCLSMRVVWWEHNEPWAWRGVVLVCLSMIVSW